jgi:outer membrane protein assembly factor BamB
MVGPHDQTTAFLNGVQVYRSPTQNGTDSTPSRYDGRAADFVPLDIAHGVLEPSNNVLAIAVRRARVESNVSSSTSVFPPRLVLVSPEALTGPVIDAWDADTGQPRWQIALQATGRYIEGPAGATRDGIMYFTGGGSDPGGRGETVAIRAADGQRLWSTPVAYASRTGTPSLAGDLLILPGSHRLPLAAISIQDGRLVWQQKRWTGLEFVHAASVCADGFTVNTKYQGGAMLHDTATGERRLHGGSEIDLAGQGHTCGTIVLLGSGYAVAATNRGIFFTDLQTGEIVYQTPGFASQTCPNPAFAEGRMFYAPLNNGMIYCFEPVFPSLGRAEQ